MNVAGESMKVVKMLEVVAMIVATERQKLNFSSDTQPLTK